MGDSGKGRGENNGGRRQGRRRSRSPVERSRPTRWDNPRDRKRGDGGGLNPARILVKNLPYELKWQSIKDTFRKEVGDVAFVDVLESPDGKSKGVALIEFRNKDHAKKACEKMHKFKIGDRELVVREARERDYQMFDRTRDIGRGMGDGDMGRGSMGPGQGDVTPEVLAQLGIEGPISNTVFVANLAYDVTRHKLAEVFKLAGNVVNAEIKEDKNGKSRGMGIVEFEFPIEAVQAVSMFNGQILFDRKMMVRIDKLPPEEKPSGPKLPSGLKSIGMGLGSGGAPINIGQVGNMGGGPGMGGPMGAGGLGGGLGAGGLGGGNMGMGLDVGLGGGGGGLGAAGSLGGLGGLGAAGMAGGLGGGNLGAGMGGGMGQAGAGGMGLGLGGGMGQGLNDSLASGKLGMGAGDNLGGVGMGMSGLGGGAGMMGVGAGGAGLGVPGGQGGVGGLGGMGMGGGLDAGGRGGLDAGGRNAFDASGRGLFDSPTRGGFDTTGRAGGLDMAGRQGGFDMGGRSGGFDAAGRNGNFDMQGRVGGMDPMGRGGMDMGMGGRGGMDMGGRGFDAMGRSGLEGDGRGGLDMGGRGDMSMRGGGGLDMGGRGGFDVGMRGGGGFESGGRGGLDIGGRGGDAGGRGGRGNRSGGRGGSITVKNLPYSLSWQDLRDRFRDIGEVQFAEIIMDKGRPSGDAIIRFAHEEDAIRAVKAWGESKLSVAGHKVEACRKLEENQCRCIGTNGRISSDSDPLNRVVHVLILIRSGGGLDTVTGIAEDLEE
ncbi:hypothetical protein BaRGS_00027633 [Batillaria attramentaria]|uniref:RRM domain-containing protein n=1 Tax=Batillaria attramentaria TaxID=370345 RepID=A0ABD0K2M2_9CAEN